MVRHLVPPSLAPNQRHVSTSVSQVCRVDTTNDEDLHVSWVKDKLIVAFFLGNLLNNQPNRVEGAVIHN